MQKKVSVVVPVYNVREYIDECLASIVNQTYSNLEILAVDDGSTDDSQQKIKAWREKDSRVFLVAKENGGLSDARNAGIAVATGDYIACIDGDDTIAPTMIEKLVNALEETDSEIAVCDMLYTYPDGTSKPSSGGDFTTTNIQENPSLIGKNNSACNKLYCASLFQEITFPKGKNYEDLATIPILFYNAKRVVKVDEPLYFYRQRGGSISHSASPIVFDIYDAIDRIIDYVKNHGNEPEIIKELYHLYIVHGLDITTLRIKDFKEKEERISYLKENMRRLRQSYPDYEKDTMYQNASWKKKIIFWLLKKGKEAMVLKLYDR